MKEHGEEKSIPRLIMRIAHHIKMNMDENLSHQDLTISQFKVLSYLWHHGQHKINQKQIYDFLEIKPSSMTKLIRILESKGLIKKEIDPEDCRNSIIKLTERGLENKRQCIENIKQTEGHLLEELTPEEHEILFQLLVKIKKRTVI